MSQIEDDVRVIRRRERIFVKAAPGRGGQLHRHLRIIQEYTIIPRRGLFASVRKARFVGLFIELRIPHRRHQENIAQATAACSAQMGVAEADNGGIGVMIARTAVPPFDRRIGAELDHAEGHGGAGIGVAVLGGAD